MMELYFGHDGGGDLVVPKDQEEYFDRLPSPDNWSPWGTVSGLGYSGWPNNFDDACKVVGQLDEKPHYRMSSGKGNKVINQSEAEPPHSSSYSSSDLGGVSNASLPWNSAPHGCPDLQFNRMAGTDSMDDIFLNSLLNDDIPAAANDHHSFDFLPQAQCTEMLVDDDSTSRMLGFKSFPCDTDVGGSSDNGHSTVPNLSYGNSSDQSNCEPGEALGMMGMFLADQEPGHEDSSAEESVLLGLEAVLSQMSNKTRVCFRDSLYRLAQRSQPEISTEVQMEDRPLDKQNSDVKTRSTRTVTAESQTNTIDRAVANLMFHMVDGEVHDYVPSKLDEYKQMGEASEPMPVMRACNYDLAPADSYLSQKPAKSSADSEVPVFRHRDLQPANNEPKHFARMCY